MFKKNMAKDVGHWLQGQQMGQEKDFVKYEIK